MIKTFKNKALEKLFFEDDKRKLNPGHVSKILRILDRLDASTNPQDMNLPAYKLHERELKGKMKGTWSVWVNRNWRITFEFKGNDVFNVDYLDYH